MRASFLVVLMAVLASAGCEAIKEHMPAKTANKAVTVPAEAQLVAMGTPDILSIADRSGTYYFAEDDTSKIVMVFSVNPAEQVLTPDRRSQLEAKRKYRVYFTASTAPRPTTVPAGTPAATPMM